ncbi:TRAP dicarboxylate transporter, DctQ subunit, unknown substrate 6 [hydrothermal vent metagenome]|uniref:Tripartite ATP-independent periplasmic transporters DctQ component domain-containing protein n=1 Tax=hydrothermal vent metagenome TaxID=652676 RepID=A0A3B1C9G7_9ZZZZ
MGSLLKVSEFLDGINERIGKTVSWLVLFLTLLTAWDVTARYLFHSGSVALQELEWHIFATIFLLSAGYTLKNNAHVRVDIIYSRLSKKGRAVINLFGSLLFLLPFCTLMIYASSGFVESSFSVRESSGDPGGLPARYILKAMIPAGFFLLLVQGVSLILRSLAEILERSTHEDGSA